MYLIIECCRGVNYTLAPMNNVELLVRGQVLKDDEVTISVPDKANEAMKVTLERAKKITVITDTKTQNRASLVAQELQGLRKGLEANYRAAKAPVLNAERALDRLYKELDQPLEKEYRRMDRIVSEFGEEQRRESERIEAERRAEERRIEEEAQAKLRELERLKAEAELKAKFEEDARAKKAAERQVVKIEEKIQSEQVSLQIEKENLPNVELPVPTKPIGGRPWTDYEVRCTDVAALYKARPDLLKIELREGMAKTVAKILDESKQPLDSIPGLEIKRVARTSFKGASAIRIQGE